MDQINIHNAQMVRHIAEIEGQSALLKGQLQECEMQWNKAIAENAASHQKVTLLNIKADASSFASDAVVCSMLACPNGPFERLKCS